MLKPISIILHTLLLLVFIGTWGSVVYYFEFAPSLTSAAKVASPPTALSSSPVATDTVIPTSIPSPTATMIVPTPDANWTLLQPGLERRVFEIYNNQNQHAESLYVWRLDQNHFRMDVAYVERPKSLETWQQETNADLVLNGGYFSIENERYFPDGLAISNGEAFGRSFNGFGGMLAIDQSGAELRWLVQEPYNSDEPLQAALQAFPILVQPGGELGFPADRENYARARRTAVAQDRDGRIPC